VAAQLPRARQLIRGERSLAREAVHLLRTGRVWRLGFDGKVALRRLEIRGQHVLWPQRVEAAPDALHDLARYGCTTRCPRLDSQPTDLGARANVRHHLVDRPVAAIRLFDPAVWV